MICIIFWFNPATWLLKREIRQNLEFLADNKVIESGFDSKTYQYHLLQLSYQTPEIKLANKFNVSPLKKRIIMMNQKKSAKASLLKYSLIVPLALALVLSSNAQSVVNKAKKAINSKEVVTEQKTEKTSPKETVETTQKAVEIAKPLPMSLQSTMPANELTDPVLKTDVKANNEPFMVVEKMPQYPGGEKALMEYIGGNLKYPEDAMKKGEQGRLIIRFVVNAMGKVEKTEVLRGLSPSMDAEALRVVNAMPEWIPGEQKGQKVPVYYTLPITFRLQGGSKQSSTMLSVKRLFVLDGITMPKDFDMKSIKAEDIASIDVIKPDTETKKADLIAKYGADAENGVIIITSKK
jgi:TonB family protein